MSRPPSDAEQLAFLADVQRILDQGQFTATYKFALLLALVELAVEDGDDSGGPATISLDAIAEKFIALYWTHTRPYRGATLVQNAGRNIAVLRQIEHLQRTSPRLSQARQLPEWKTLREAVRNVVVQMPLFRLQLLRNNHRLAFLYDNQVVGDKLTLKPGVVYCLRRFSSLIGTLVRSAWVEEVRRNPQNAYELDGQESLDLFLFGEERVDLAEVRDVLWDMQSGHCFYCDGRMGATPHVDHFIPWSAYPSNLGHNLVLAHPACNGDKSDLLAGVDHLMHWWERNERDGGAIAAALAPRGLATGVQATKGIAAWAYHRARVAASLLWNGRGRVSPFPRTAQLPF